MDLPVEEEAEITAGEAKLNKLGGEGWEVVAVIARDAGPLAFLKMPHELGTF